MATLRVPLRHQLQRLDRCQCVQWKSRGLNPTRPLGCGGDPGGVHDDELGLGPREAAEPHRQSHDRIARVERGDLRTDRIHGPCHVPPEDIARLRRQQLGERTGPSR